MTADEDVVRRFAQMRFVRFVNYPDGTLHYLTFCTDVQRTMFRHHESVVQADVTYSVNAYGYHVLVLAVTSERYATEVAGYALLRSEKQDTLEGALRNFVAMVKPNGDLRTETFVTDNRHLLQVPLDIGEKTNR